LGELDQSLITTANVLFNNITSSGNISSSGYVSASYFAGDGYGLTNLNPESFDLQDLTDGDGIVDFTYDGTSAAIVSVDSASMVSYYDTQFVSQFGDTMTGDLYVNANISASGNLYIDGNVSMSDALFIDNNTGYVGIGTDSPTSQLHVKGTLARLEITDDGGSSEIRLNSYGSVRTNKIYIDGYDNMVFSADHNNEAGNSSINFDIDGDRKVKILSTGYIGIGNTNPPMELTVEGDISASGNVYANSIEVDEIITTLTEGSVVFISSSGELSEDNSNLH